MKDSIEKIHDINLEILKEVDRIARNNNINYFIESGTLLGAVRHKGFIPWDDDIDLLVKREDIDKFISVCEKELDSKYKIVKPNEFNGHFFDFVPRIVVESSRLREETEEDIFYGNNQNRVALDIFILDSTSSNKIFQKIKAIELKIIYGLAMGHRFKIDYSKYSLLNKIYVAFLAFVGRRIKLKSIFKWQSKVAKKYNKSDSEYCMVSNYILREIGLVFRKKWYDSYEYKRFENTELRCPVGWDNILRRLYGNYMELPPEHERVYAHMDEEGFLDGSESS